MQDFGELVVTIMLKNADGVTADALIQNIERGISVLQFKQMLSQGYAGEPPPSSQKIVFSGRSVQQCR